MDSNVHEVNVNSNGKVDDIKLKIEEVSRNNLTEYRN